MYELLQIILDLDTHLVQWTQDYGMGIYLILFLIIFAETGLVFMPFLPGDSLLFAVGTVAALPDSALKIEWLIPLLILASFLGDNLNYFVGRKIGEKILNSPRNVFIKKSHILKTNEFFARWGRWAVVLARFAPIVRTMAPFVAGVGRMPYKTYLSFSLLGAFLWIGGFSLLGYFLGNIPWVQEHLHLLVFSVIGLSVLPIVIGAIKSFRK